MITVPYSLLPMISKFSEINFEILKLLFSELQFPKTLLSEPSWLPLLLLMSMMESMDM